MLSGGSALGREREARRTQATLALSGSKQPSGSALPPASGPEHVEDDVTILGVGILVGIARPGAEK